MKHLGRTLGRVIFALGLFGGTAKAIPWHHLLNGH